MSYKLLALAAACGGSHAQPVAAPTTSAEKTGSSGVRSLDWGASADAACNSSDRGAGVLSASFGKEND